MTMHELVKVTLENELDLILAHKRSMKLAELAGLSLPAQTTFATAVSEVARNTIETKSGGCLVLSVEADRQRPFIVACLKDKQSSVSSAGDGLGYARKLVTKCQVSKKGSEICIELFYQISPPSGIDTQKINEWRHIFQNEPAISPYEELKRKNEQLRELSEKVQRSEAQYRTLTNSLPITIFTLDSKGRLLYANEWLLVYTGQTIEQLNETRWKVIVYPEDYPAFLQLMNKSSIRQSI